MKLHAADSRRIIGQDEELHGEESQLEWLDRYDICPCVVDGTIEGIMKHVALAYLNGEDGTEIIHTAILTGFQVGFILGREIPQNSEDPR